MVNSYYVIVVVLGLVCVGASIATFGVSALLSGVFGGLAVSGVYIAGFKRGESEALKGRA